MIPPKPTRLLLLSPLPPPVGGITTWTLGLLDSSLARRFDVRVVDTSPSEKEAVSGGSRLRLDRIIDALRILTNLLRALVGFQPVLVHVNTPYRWAIVRDALAIWIARGFGARTILHFRGGDFPESVAGLPRLLRWALLVTLRRTHRLIALTQHTRSYLESVAGAERVRYLPNFISLQDMGKPPDRSVRHGRSVRVLFVGWILAAKGVRELLVAASEVEDAWLTLVGPEEPGFANSLRDVVAALAPRVEILPSRPRADLMTLYREADVFVLPTWREGFPNVVLEAMASGLPVIATPVGAIADAIRDGVEGLLVPPRDPKALAAALRRLVSDRDLRLEMGKCARHRARTVFSRDVVLSQLEAIYQELLES